MAQAKKLSARAVETMTEPGRHSDGDGLYLNITTTGAKSWLFMWKKDGKRREMGLGSFADVSLSKAREKTKACREVLADGKDPIEIRDAAKKAAIAIPTFGKCADDLIAEKEKHWRNDKHKAQWRMTLDVYAAPLRSRAVDRIDTEAVLGVLKPLWHDKPETASRLRGRIEAVLDAARVLGHRPENEANPACWRGHLDKLLTARKTLTRGHHAAMPYEDVPAFVARLRERAATTALALEFVVLTAARSGEVRGAQWSEFDFDKKVWTIPGARMKAGREHRVPLSDRAAEIVEKLAEAKTGDFVFPGNGGRKPLSVMAMDMLLRRMDVDVTVHGFRSAFRDWAGNETHFPREVAEQALAHILKDKTEAAYRRSDALEKRRALMEAWENYCEPKGAAGNIVQFAREK
jgi:integrase